MHRTNKWALVVVVVVVLGVSGVFADMRGVVKKKPLPHNYGNVIISNFSEKNDIAPVMFNHWLHRAKYTCRLCHVDLGFAMEANGTQIREADNKKGFYCGACHNEKEAFGPESKKFLGPTVKNCDRCHSVGKDVVFKEDFYKFTADFPRGRFGNRIDWEKAEEEGKIKLKDYLEGVSIKRAPLNLPADEKVKAKVQGMPDIIFSHKKHAVWNGCELCHPDIFDVRKGGTKYGMSDIFQGRYCGLCHGKVAFPNRDCQRCHSKPVQASVE
jgi:c(7)-type cytochrome triheme protein